MNRNDSLIIHNRLAPRCTRTFRLSFFVAIFLVIAAFSEATEKFARPGKIEVIAGSEEQGFSGDGSDAGSARFSGISSVAVDSLGHIYLVDGTNNRIRKIDCETNVVSTVVGDGSPTTTGDNEPGISATTHLPSGIVVTPEDRLIFSEFGGHCIRMLDLDTGMVTRLAGTGEAGFDGDGGPALSAQFNNPTALALSADHRLYAIDATNRRIREIDLETGTCRTVAGNGTKTFQEGAIATNTGLDRIGARGLAVDSTGELLFSTLGFLRRLNVETGALTTIAGSGEYEYNGDRLPANETNFWYLDGVHVDQDDNILFWDSSWIRRVEPTSGTVRILAGTRWFWERLNGNRSAPLRFVSSTVAWDKSGRLLCGDSTRLLAISFDSTPPRSSIDAYFTDRRRTGKGISSKSAKHQTIRFENNRYGGYLSENIIVENHSDRMETIELKFRFRSRDFRFRWSHFNRGLKGGTPAILLPTKFKNHIEWMPPGSFRVLHVRFKARPRSRKKPRRTFQLSLTARPITSLRRSDRIRYQYTQKRFRR